MTASKPTAAAVQIPTFRRLPPVEYCSPLGLRADACMSFGERNSVGSEADIDSGRDWRLPIRDGSGSLNGSVACSPTPAGEEVGGCCREPNAGRRIGVVTAD